MASVNSVNRKAGYKKCINIMPIGCVTNLQINVQMRE